MAQESRSRAALAQAREREEAVLGRLDRDAAAQVGDELASVSTLLDSQFSLRRALADDTASPDARAQLARRLLSGQVSDDTLDVLGDVVRLRWASPLDLTSALGDLAAEALLATAEKDERLDEVEDELFRFARILEREPRLSLALSDPALPGERKSGLLGELLDGKAQPTTLALIRAALAETRGHGLEARLDRLATLAAARRQRLVAVVRVARPLSDEQADRMRSALARTYGRDVHLQVDLDDTILGGVVVEIGDEIIDGSVTRRIAQARQRLG